MDLKTVDYEKEFEEMLNKLKATKLDHELSRSPSTIKHGLTALATSSPCSSHSVGNSLPIKVAIVKKNKALKTLNFNELEQTEENQPDIRDLITSEDLDLNRTIRQNQLSLLLAALDDSDDE